MIEVYTDGSCLGNPGPGGWGAVIFDKDNNQKNISGNEKNTTNNRMELLAAIMALKKIKSKHMLYLLRKIEFVDVKWVKAHNGNEKNEIVDTQAREYAYLFSKKE